MRIVEWSCLLFSVSAIFLLGGCVTCYDRPTQCHTISVESVQGASSLDDAVAARKAYDNALISLKQAVKVAEAGAALAASREAFENRLKEAPVEALKKYAPTQWQEVHHQQQLAESSPSHAASTRQAYEMALACLNEAVRKTEAAERAWLAAQMTQVERKHEDLTNQIASATTGHLVVRASPPTAKVQVDGQRVGGGTVAIQAGRHQIRVASPGYKTQTKAFDVAPDEHKEVVIDLELRPLPPSL